jgi:DHA1 family multidrug resistance protein-like MFS transporter
LSLGIQHLHWIRDFSVGIADVVRVFDVSQVAATLGLTLFIAGYGLGPVSRLFISITSVENWDQMLWAPMSEIPHIGRNPIYIGTLVIFVLFQVATAIASNFGMLLAFRFLAGLFGSPVLATVGVNIRDMNRLQKQAYGLAIWGIAAVCGPVLGSLVGSFAAQAKGWTWTIWELMW